MCLINTFDLIRLAFYRPIRWINVLLPGLTNECTHFKFRWRYKCYVLSLCIFPHVSDFMPVYASNSFMFQKMFNRSHLGHTQAVVRRIQCNTGTGSFWDQYGSVACIDWPDQLPELLIQLQMTRTMAMWPKLLIRFLMSFLQYRALQLENLWGTSTQGQEFPPLCIYPTQETSSLI